MVTETKKEKKVKKEFSRVVAGVKALNKLRETGGSLENALLEADKIYVSGGGVSNLKEARYSLNRAVEVFEALGLLKISRAVTVTAKVTVDKPDEKAKKIG